ncbi:nitrilase-related carbon-nitrogen hydrolase [Streptomyces sp. NPDC005438]
MRVALAQVDCALGEVEANLALAREQVDRSVDQGADLVVFPELSLNG